MSDAELFLVIFLLWWPILNAAAVSIFAITVLND